MLSTSLKDKDIDKTNMTETKKYFCCNMKKEKKPTLNRVYLLAKKHELSLRKQKSTIFCQR